MAVTELQSKNRGSVSKYSDCASKKPVTRNSKPAVKTAAGLLESAARFNVSTDGSCSSDSSASASSGTVARLETRRKQIVLKPVKAVRMHSAAPSAAQKRRCSWITANTDPCYVAFHDEEWGVPVYDNRKLFELLVLSEAFGELSWPAILNNRENFRKLFDDFDATSVAKYTDKKILSLKESCSDLLSEPKLRAVVENARLMPKIAEEFGSFGNYCWGFVNHKPIKNEYRYARQVPIKTSKAEVMSKDLMRRGFRFVGPTIIYSFMQAAGLVNDHLSSCFKFKDSINGTNSSEAESEKLDSLVKGLDNACSVQT